VVPKGSTKHEERPCIWDISEFCFQEKLNEELAARAPGDAILLVTDDPTSPIEMVRWSDQTGHPVLAHRKEGTLHHFLVRKEADPKPRRRPL